MNTNGINFRNENKYSRNVYGVRERDQNKEVLMNEIVTKKCKKCGESKNVNEFYSRADGQGVRLRSQCKACFNLCCKRYAQLHPEKTKAKDAKYKKEHPEARKEAYRKYYQTHPEKVKAKEAKYRKEHPEKYREHNARYKKKYPEANRARSNKRRAIKKGNGGSFTVAEWLALCEGYDNKCLCCGEKKKLTADHVVPLVKGGENYIRNIQPLCLSCNSRKGTKTIDYRTIPESP